MNAQRHRVHILSISPIARGLRTQIRLTQNMSSFELRATSLRRGRRKRKSHESSARIGGRRRKMRKRFTHSRKFDSIREWDRFRYVLLLLDCTLHILERFISRRWRGEYFVSSRRERAESPGNCYQLFYPLLDFRCRSSLNRAERMPGNARRSG